MKTFLLKSHFLTIVFLIANLFFAHASFGQATVTTDKDDYAPGEYVIITGTGWAPGETVTLHFDETPKPATCLLPHDRTVVADAVGNIYYNQFLIKENHLGVAFVLTATGQTSGLVATRNFTDANITVAATGLPLGASLQVSYRLGSGALVPSGSYSTTATFIPPATPTTFVQNNNQYIDFIFPTVISGGITYESTTINAAGTIVTGPTLRYLMPSASGKTFIGIYVATCTAPSAPTISSPVIYCQGITAIPLTATGSNLLWYSDATGGIGSSIAPTPSTNLSGTTSYYVSQTVGCESPRAKIDVTVNPLPATPTAENYSETYDGLQHVGSANVGIGETIDWYTSATGGITTNAPSGTNVGVYTAWAEARNIITGCKSATRTLVTVTITKKAASVSPIANTKEYGASEPTLAGNLVGFLTADAVTASYSRTSGETVLGTYSISAVLSPTGVLSNYDITYNTAAFTITTKAASVSPIANTKVYGSPEPMLTGTLVGFLESDAVTASYSRTAGETVLGTYSISAVLNPMGVLSNYDITYNTAAFTITTKAASVSPIANTKVYGSPEPMLTGTLVGFLESDAVTASYSRTSGETVLGGPYTISAVLNPTGVLSNYDITYNTAAFTITTKAASVSPIANMKVYGSPEPMLTGTLVGFLESDAVTASYSRTSGETVLGTYSINAVLSPTGVLSNYDITYNTAAFTITTKAASVSPIANTKVYGSPEPMLTGTLVGFLESDAVTASYSRTSGETVLGTYSISAVLNPTGVLSNYDITYNTAAFTITTKAASVSPIANMKVYGSPEPVLTGTLVGFLESDAVTASYSRTSGETVLGTYSISAVLSPTGVLSNYDITYNTAAFTITTKAASVSPIANTKVYGSPEPMLTGTLVGFLESDAVTASYSRTSGETVLGTYSISAVLSPTGVLSNYDITYNTAAFTIITKAASVSPIANTKVYGSPEPLLTGTLVGFLESDAVTASYSRTSGETVLGGPYTISAVLNPMGVLSNYDITYNTAAFTITIKTASVSPIANTKVYGSLEPVLTGTLVGFLESDAVTASYSRTAGETVLGGPYTISAVLSPMGVLSNYDITHNTAAFTITTKSASVVVDLGQTKVYGSSDPALFTGVLAGFMPAELVTASYTRVTGETVGTYAITATLAPAAVLGNYNITNTGANFAITPGNLTVTANTGQTKVYGATDPTLTYTITGFVNGDDEADLDTPVSIARAAGENVGNYTITPSAAVDANYTISFPTAQFAITKAALTVTADAGQTKVYGATDPTLTYTITGFVNGDDEADLDTPVSIARAAGENVGNYTITPSAAVDANYTISFPTAQFAITKATLTVTADAGQTKVYGGVEPTLTYTITGFVNGDDEADLDTPVSIARAVGENVGNYTITPSAAVDANYTISFPTAQFAITKAALTVTADAGQTKVYGATDPTLTYTITGFVNGDDEADLDTPVSIARAAGENVGNYTITPSAAVDANYTISFPTAQFAITKATLTVTADAGQTKVYGATDPTLTYTITGFVNGDDEADLDTPVSIARAAGENVGNYTITPSAGADANYTVGFVTSNFAITKANLTVTANNQTKVYGATNPALTFQYSGWVNGEEAIDTPPSITTTVDGTTIVGNYPDAITLSGGLDNNYTFNLVAGYFEVTKAVLTATADNKTKYCGQANPVLTFQYSGWVNGVETIDTPPIIATTVNLTTSAGIYPGSITLSGGLDNNYSFSILAGTLTVYGVSIDASASSAPVALGSVATLSATVTSTVSGNLSGIPVIFTLDNGNGTPITYPAVSTDSNGLATYSVSGLSVEVYKIMVVAGSGCASSTAYLAVYDPNGGFVTGGGWINSPLGAYTANPALTGKANFGFNAKYKKGSTQVDGNTEFQFQTGNLNFSSSSHDAMSLVIAGAQAIYKGKGTINGISGFSFMVSAIDGNKKSPIVPDKFRIKIWNTLNGVIVYDNQIGAADNADATTVIGGGSIVIHEVKKNGTAKAVIVEETPEIEPLAITAYPNPSTQYFIIEIKGGTTEKTEVIVYDILGRMVKHIQNSDSKEIKFGEELSSGSYIAIINQGTQQKTVRLIKQ